MTFTGSSVLFALGWGRSFDFRVLPLRHRCFLFYFKLAYLLFIGFVWLLLLLEVLHHSVGDHVVVYLS